MEIYVGAGPIEVSTNDGLISLTSTAVPLANGRFAMGWVENYSRTSFNPYEKIDETRGLTVRIVDGIDPNSSFDVNVELNYNSYSQIDLVGLVDGGLVTMIEFYDATQADWTQELRILDANGNWRGQAFRYDSGVSNSASEGSLVALSDGGFLLVHERYNSTQPGFGVDIFAQRFSATGQEIGAAFGLANRRTGDQGSPLIAELTGGNLAVIWTEGSWASTAVLKVIAADGTPVSSEQSIGIAAPTGVDVSTTGFKVAALSDGRFAVIWQHNIDIFGPSQDTQSWLALFDANGTQVGASTQIGSEADPTEQNPQIVALPGGDMLIAWTQYVSNARYGFQFQVFGSDLQPKSPQYGPEGQFGSSRVEPRFAALPDGRILALTDGTTIEAWIYDSRNGPVRQSGSALGDQMVGTGWGDTLVGLAGDDDIGGGTGNDVLEGGVGHDSLWGWTGRDTLIGGAGNDLVVGQDDDDLLSAGAGSDTLFGGAGNDYLTGANYDAVFDPMSA